MKKTLTIATLILGFSAVVGSASAASNNMWMTSNSSETISVDEAAKMDDSTNFAKMAKEKGITLEELFAQLEKEGKVTKAVRSTESIKAEGTIELPMSSNINGATKSSEPVNLEEMAKEKGITVDELIAQLEKEGKLMKAEKVTDSIPAEKSNK